MENENTAEILENLETLAIKEYPEEWNSDIDGDSYDSNKNHRDGFAHGFLYAMKMFTDV